jgi:hypothetical protein
MKKQIWQQGIEAEPSYRSFPEINVIVRGNLIGEVKRKRKKSYGK